VHRTRQLCDVAKDVELVRSWSGGSPAYNVN
jgi:hypothetical protein